MAKKNKTAMKKKASKQKITIYKSDSCAACGELVPEIKKLSKGKKGLSIKVVDVEKCKTKMCDTIGYVPYITINGKEVTSTKQLMDAIGSK